MINPKQNQIEQVEVIEYRIAFGKTLQGVTNTVNAMSMQGYAPFGGLTVKATLEGDDFYQPVVRMMKINKLKENLIEIKQDEKN